MRKLSAVGVCAVLLIPFVSAAATQEELRAQAEALLAQVQLLQQQLGAAGGSDTTTVQKASTGGAPAACPLIGRTLKRGSSGDDVSRLQQFLAADPAIYPEAMSTGYYGALTEKAVQRWQAKFNIVSSGTPESTGYGVVGPRTAAAIAIICAGGSINGVSGANMSSPVGGFIQVSPISGVAPLVVNIQATINTTKSCSAAVYTLDFGDGTAAQPIPLSSGVCKEQNTIIGHVYQFAGTFKMTLSAGGHQTSATVIVGGQGGGSTQTGTQVTAIQIADNTFTPKTLTVSSGTKVTWTNVGHMPHNVIADNNSFQSPTLQPGQSYSQTFTLPGNYPYYCSFHGSPGNGMTGLITVTGGSGGGGGGSVTSTYGPLAVTPGSGGNALAVSIQFDLPGCPAYSVDWGDGTSGVTSSSAGCPSSGNLTLTHTYTHSGSYAITLVRGSQTDAASVVISK